MSDDYRDHPLRRRLGLDALRRLRQLVDADLEQQRSNARWARRLGWGFALAALLALLLLAQRLLR